MSVHKNTEFLQCLKVEENPDKSRQIFLNKLEGCGGVYKSSNVMKILSVSETAVIKYGETHKLIMLKWGSDILFPVFQFSTNEWNNEKGMLKGVPELLALITHKVSDVRKCNFFTEKIEVPNESERISILDVLRRGCSEEQMGYFHLLAKNFGTNNLM